MNAHLLFYLSIMKRLIFILLVLVFASNLKAQSIEFMVGDNGKFLDVQWLKFIDTSYHWSVFSRTRATADYEDKTDLFTGAYLNYTTKTGFGLSLVGKIGSSGSGADAGIHYFKKKTKWVFFGLASAGAKSNFEYSWFSIFRYTPAISDKWKLYFSLELFTLFQDDLHLISVQRMRLGLGYKGFQFGVADNLSQTGDDFSSKNNFGGYVGISF